MTDRTCGECRWMVANLIQGNKSVAARCAFHKEHITADSPECELFKTWDQWYLEQQRCWEESC